MDSSPQKMSNLEVEIRAHVGVDAESEPARTVLAPRATLATCSEPTSCCIAKKLTRLALGPPAGPHEHPKARASMNWLVAKKPATAEACTKTIR